MPPTENELRAAIGRADQALGVTRAAEGQPPQHVLPVPATPAADGQAFTDEDVAAWSGQLFGKPNAKSGRVAYAKD